jgi:hypothetical protein
VPAWISARTLRVGVRSVRPSDVLVVFSALAGAVMDACDLFAGALQKRGL